MRHTKDQIQSQTDIMGEKLENTWCWQIIRVVNYDKSLYATHTHTYANKCESTNGNHGLLSCIYLARNLAGENFLLLIICLIACISCACCDLDVFSRSTSRNNKATVVHFIIFGVNLVYFIIITVSFCIEAICHFILKLMYNFIKQSSAARSVSWSV